MIVTWTQTVRLGYKFRLVSYRAHKSDHFFTVLTCPKMYWIITALFLWVHQHAKDHQLAIHLRGTCLFSDYINRSQVWVSSISFEECNETLCFGLGIHLACQRLTTNWWKLDSQTEINNSLSVTWVYFNMANYVNHWTSSACPVSATCTMTGLEV